MRIHGAAVLLTVPLIAILLLGASVAWRQLETIDPVLTGSIR